jgi:mono/diheme cytochrome c family protein
MNAERTARLFVIGLLLGLPLALFLARWFAPGDAPGQAIEIHARMAEAGGWTPADLTVAAGEPLHLRLTSDDVVHGFAIGQSAAPPLDVEPGKVVETTLAFDRPGKYVFYCTRWCGPDHWRMRGTIEVLGESAGTHNEAPPKEAPPKEAPPLYVSLGIDIDSPHPAAVIPDQRPSAARGAALGISIPANLLSLEYFRSHSPAAVWQTLRAASLTKDLSDEQVWDLVALAWRLNAGPQSLAEGGQLFAQNCAACHGESGGGDGVMAALLKPEVHSTEEFGHDIQAPVDFTDSAILLGASPALLQGKILRGGMGTGMPYFGPLLTEAQTWALVDYLWTFQFEMEELP